MNRPHHRKRHHWHCHKCCHTLLLAEAVTVFQIRYCRLGGSKTFKISSRVYKQVVSPTTSSSGTIILSVAAAKARDAAGNSNTAATQATQAFDTAAPSLTITDNTTGTATSAVTYTFSFSEDVTGFSKSDIAVSGGSKGTFSGSGDSYSLIVSPTSDSSGTITVDVDDVATDAAGNSNTAYPSH